MSEETPVAGMPVIEQWAAEHEVYGGWTLQEHEIEGRSFQLLLPADPDFYLEQIESLDEPGRTVFDPFWAQLWPVSKLLAGAILRRSWPPGTRALEVGCGVGLAGLAAMAAGLEVTLSDYVPLALKTAQENARRNGLTPAGVLLLDWRSPPSLAFSWVFGCDVLYECTLHEPLLNTLQRVLAEDGEAWIADPGRSGGLRFVEMAPDWGLHVRLYDEDDRELDAATSGKPLRIVLRKAKP